MSEPKIFGIEIASEDALGEWAAKLAKALPAGCVILLHGTLGAGKTSFSRVFIRALCGESIEVVSPTFLLVQEYAAENGHQIYHYDFYRLEHPDEVWELGVEEQLGSATMLVEWPDKTNMEWPEDRIEIDLSILDDAPDARHMVASFYGNVLGRLQDQSFISGSLA